MYWVGNVDVWKVVNPAMDRFPKPFSSKKRMRSYGSMKCGTYETTVN